MRGYIAGAKYVRSGSNKGVEGFSSLWPFFLYRLDSKESSRDNNKDRKTDDTRYYSVDNYIIQEFIFQS